MSHDRGPRTARGKLQCGRFSVLYEMCGQRDGIPVVCVGGPLLDTGSWRIVVDRLRDRLPVVVFDLLESRPMQGHCGPAASLDEQLEALGCVVEAVAPSGPVNLLGVSWGSLVAAHYAASARARVQRLLLGSFALRTSPRLNMLVEAGISAIRNGEAWRCADLLVTALSEPLPHGIRLRIRSQIHNLGVGHPHILHELFAWTRGAELEARIDLSGIRAQTLAVAGGRDRLISMQDAILSPHRIPDSVVALIPEAGHFLHLEHPGILSLYRRFMLDGRTTWGSREMRGTAPAYDSSRGALQRWRRQNAPA